MILPNVPSNHAKKKEMTLKIDKNVSKNVAVLTHLFHKTQR